MPEKDFDRVLDECVDRLNRGERPEACLADYPAYSARLEPLLRAAAGTKTVYSFTPSADAKRAAGQRFHKALEQRKRPSFWQSFFAHRVALTTAATVVVIAVAVFFTLKTVVFQPQIPTIAVQAPSADGNFAFLVSDEVNALSDFDDLMVTIDKVSMLHTGNSSLWIEFTPEVKEFDLTLLPGDVSQEIWRGNITAGEYSKVVIYVSAVRGTLKSSNETLEIKLPGNKLQMDLPFHVGTGSVTRFTYDLTVIKAGGTRNGKYLLKPQIGESGTERPSAPVTSQDAGRNQTTGHMPAALPDKAGRRPGKVTP